MMRRNSRSHVRAIKHVSEALKAVSTNIDIER